MIAFLASLALVSAAAQSQQGAVFTSAWEAGIFKIERTDGVASRCEPVLNENALVCLVRGTGSFAVSIRDVRVGFANLNNQEALCVVVGEQVDCTILD